MGRYQERKIRKMGMNPDQIATAKAALFLVLRKSLADAGLTTVADDVLICPLCWKEKRLDELSLEHCIPGSVSGETFALTCTPCNNTHGSKLDSHLKGYQALTDALKGKGAVRVRMNDAGRRAAANMEFEPDKGIHFKIVGKATREDAWKSIKKSREAGDTSPFKVTMQLGHTIVGLKVGLLRAGYLLMFRRFGYWFASTPAAAQIRDRIMNPSAIVPDVMSLTGEFRDFPVSLDTDHVLIQADINGVRFIFVVIRLKRETESIHFAMMPLPHERQNEFFALAEQHAKHNPVMTFENIPPSAIIL